MKEIRLKCVLVTTTHVATPEQLGKKQVPKHVQSVVSHCAPVLKTNENAKALSYPVLNPYMIMRDAVDGSV